MSHVALSESEFSMDEHAAQGRCYPCTRHCPAFVVLAKPLSAGASGLFVKPRPTVHALSVHRTDC
jgi:hypothetical protein